MASIEELELSIQQYGAQIAQVDEALKSCSNDTEKQSLENLKCDLQELLELTCETLNEQRKPTDNINDDDELENEEIDNEDPYAKEMALFMSELGRCDPKPSATATSTSIQENVSSVSNCSKQESQQELAKFKSELDSLIGKKCSAQYTFAWGARSYHNAIICGLESDLNCVDKIEDVNVIVLFTNPIHRNMVPCPYYLDGDCRFENDKCRFSHGESVQYTNLQEYKKPNFSLLNHVKQPVLAKQSDNIWYKGRVQSSNFNDKTCQIRLEHNKQEIKCDFHDILPIEEDKSSVTSDSETDSSDDDDIELIQRATLIEKSLFTPVADQPLGEWEKYTKGFGSRMLQKFGYVIGTGLGQNGEGIVVPISAHILPPGRSLDHCMELRAQANGDANLFSVERKLKRQREKAEAQSAKVYEREKQKVDVFTFINENIFTNRPTTSAASQSNNELKQQKVDFKHHSTKNLNVESLKIGEDIRRMERDIIKLQESLRRQKDNTSLSQQLNMQLNARRTELDRMRKSETSLKKEQVFRKDKSKLTIF